jgi:hypothetical protein
MPTNTKILEVESFNNFIRVLTNLKEVCNDADIRQGILRQRTNNHTSVFEVNLLTVFSESNIALTNLKQKLELLKSFQGQKVEVIIDEPDDGTSGSYTFKDEHSSIKFITPTMEFMDNKFMDEEELTSIFPASQDHLLLEKDLSVILSDRIKTVTHYFNIETIVVEFNGETAAISASTPSRDQTAKFADGIIINEEIENATTNISNVAFALDHEDNIKYTMFKDPNQNVALNKFSTNVGDIDINVYSRSQIVENDEG